MQLSDFLCASLDQCNIFRASTKKTSLISKLNRQNLANFTAKCDKFFYFCGKIWDYKLQFSTMPDSIGKSSTSCRNLNLVSYDKMKDIFKIYG